MSWQEQHENRVNETCRFGRFSVSHDSFLTACQLAQAAVEEEKREEERRRAAFMHKFQAQKVPHRLVLYFYVVDPE